MQKSGRWVIIFLMYCFCHPIASTGVLENTNHTFIQTFHQLERGFCDINLLHKKHNDPSYTTHAFLVSTVDVGARGLQHLKVTGARDYRDRVTAVFHDKNVSITFHGMRLDDSGELAIEFSCPAWKFHSHKVPIVVHPDPRKWTSRPDSHILFDGQFGAINLHRAIISGAPDVEELHIALTFPTTDERFTAKVAPGHHQMTKHTYDSLPSPIFINSDHSFIQINIRIDMMKHSSADLEVTLYFSHVETQWVEMFKIKHIETSQAPVIAEGTSGCSMQNPTVKPFIAIMFLLYCVAAGQ